MRIGKPEIVRGDGRTTLRTTVRHGGQETALWYSVDPQYGDYLDTERQDGFLLGALLPAMREGEDIYLEGSISERLYYNLTNYVITLLRLIMPGLHKIAIIPERVEPERGTALANGAATSFTGGVDSFCTLADHLLDDVPNGYRVTHLVMNNTGSHGRGGYALFQQRCQRLAPFARELGLPLVSIDSNLDELLQFGHQQTHTIRNISAALILPGLFRRYYYPSTYLYEDCFVGPTYDIAYTDPTLVPLLSTASIECIADGSQYSRVEKTKRLSDLDFSHRYLDVCVDDTGRSADKNCSVCDKCLRTLLTLEILGKMDLYREVFDLAKYRRYRRWYLALVLWRKGPLAREIADLAAARHYRLHRFPWLLKWTYPFVKPRTMPRFVPAAVRPGLKRLAQCVGCYRW